MSETPDTPAELLPAESRWLEHLSWGAVFGLAFLIYELTARPAFGIAVACLKFGWSDFETAWWLLRRDPRPGRGWTCFWFYGAFGLWKVTVTAFIVTGCLLALVTVLGRNGPDEVLHLGATAAGGIVLLAIIPLVGVACARRHGVQVWIDPTINNSRRRGEWPPVAGGFNSLSALLLPAMMVPTLAAALLAFRFGGAICVPLAIFVTGVIIWSRFHGIAAVSPEDCWSDADDDSQPEAT